MQLLGAALVFVECSHAPAGHNTSSSCHPDKGSDVFTGDRTAQVARPARLDALAHLPGLHGGLRLHSLLLRNLLQERARPVSFDGQVPATGSCSEASEEGRKSSLHNKHTFLHCCLTYRLFMQLHMTGGGTCWWLLWLQRESKTRTRLRLA